MGDEPGEMGNALPALDFGADAVVTQLTAGFRHTCALFEGGRAKCWGSNDWGSLGRGHDDNNHGAEPGHTLGDDDPFIDLGSSGTVVQLAAGGSHTCALIDDGFRGGIIKCWGDNQMRQLGLNTYDPRGERPRDMGDNLPPVDLGTGQSAIQVTAGSVHTCALLESGHIKCWGLESYAYEGASPSPLGDALPFIDLGPGRTAVQIDARGLHTCALLDDGSVKCWGSNSHGQLGQGHRQNLGEGTAPSSDIPPIDLGTGRTALRITAGRLHNCALLDDHSIKCWGSNYSGRLGLGIPGEFRGAEPGEMGDALPPVDLGTGHTAVDVVAGEEHTCVLFEEGAIKCWGDNSFGQLGQNDRLARGAEASEMGHALRVIDLGTTP